MGIWLGLMGMNSTLRPKQGWSNGLLLKKVLTDLITDSMGIHTNEGKIIFNPPKDMAVIEMS
ncbi:MAG: hypothetical protein CM15mP127_14600 [Gammaproteobacteria bacterium]|nr:MAG: hypothetical protein CM15mP127_14600 [Gammaproteobacteria bacterium]